MSSERLTEPGSNTDRMARYYGREENKEKPPEVVMTQADFLYQAATRKVS
jgi:hypothetical protein